MAGRGATQEAEASYANGDGAGSAGLGEVFAAGSEDAGVGPTDGHLVRVKEFDMEPTSVDEAATKMRFLGHSFYMFLDSESDKHSVLYLREDGNYGLIQPKSA